jgi:hypothetical protein
MLPDPLQARSPLRLLHREECSTRLSPNLLGLQVLRILQPPLHPPDWRLLVRLQGRLRLLGVRCLHCKDRGHVLDMCWLSKSKKIIIPFSLVFSSLSLTLLIPLSCVLLPPGEKNKRSLAWPLKGGLYSFSDVVYSKSASSFRLGVYNYLHFFLSTDFPRK